MLEHDDSSDSDKPAQSLLTFGLERVFDSCQHVFEFGRFRDTTTRRVMQLMVCLKCGYRHRLSRGESGRRNDKRD